MQTVIAKVEHIQGLFFVSDENKEEVSLLESGDEIALDAIIFGDETNSDDDFVELSLDNGSNIQIKGVQELMFDETLSSELFSNEQSSFSVQEVQEKLALNETPVSLDFLSRDNYFEQLHASINQDNFDLRSAEQLSETDFPFYLPDDIRESLSTSYSSIRSSTDLHKRPIA